MSVYNDESNPCFAGSCKVQMSDKSEKLVKDLKKGDLVMSAHGKAS